MTYERITNKQTAAAYSPCVTDIQLARLKPCATPIFNGQILHLYNSKEGFGYFLM